MTGQQKHENAASWTELLERTDNLLKNRFSGSTESVTDREVKDWKLGEEELERTLLHYADSIDDLPDDTMLYRFDKAVDDLFIDPPARTGTFAGIGAIIGLYTLKEADSLSPELKALGAGTSAAIMGTGLLGTRSRIRVKKGEYGGRQLMADADMKSRSPGYKFDNRIEELLEEQQPVAINFLEDQFANKYCDSRSLVEDSEMMDFLEHTARNSGPMQIWLDYDEDKPLWTLQIEGEYAEPVDGDDKEYRMAVVGLNSEYELGSKTSQGYEEIMDELYGDSFRDYAFPEDAEQLEKELQS